MGAGSELSRATAGVYRNKVIIATPGSPAAVQLAWEKLIGRTGHLAWESFVTAATETQRKTMMRAPLLV